MLVSHTPHHMQLVKFLNYQLCTQLWTNHKLRRNTSPHVKLTCYISLFQCWQCQPITKQYEQIHSKLKIISALRKHACSFRWIIYRFGLVVTIQFFNWYRSLLIGKQQDRWTKKIYNHKAEQAFKYQIISICIQKDYLAYNHESKLYQ